MTKHEQLERLYELQEKIRTLQNSGLWEPLHDAKLSVINLIKEFEKAPFCTCMSPRNMGHLDSLFEDECGNCGKKITTT